jgi:hypothetical protein
VDPDVAETGQPYAYTGDNPLNSTDPLGLNPMGVFWNGVKSLGEGLVGSVHYKGQNRAAYDAGNVAWWLAAIAGVAGSAKGGDDSAAATTDDESSAFDFDNLKLTKTVAGHLSEYTKEGKLARPYINSPLTIKSIMQSDSPIADPGGAPGALRWDVPGTFNDDPGRWELVANPRSNTILHMIFTTK